MQSPAWYFRRLRSMSPAEVAWRVKAAVRDATDRYRVASGTFGPRRTPDSSRRTHPQTTFTDVEAGAWCKAAPGSVESRWLETLRSYADGIAAGRLSFFHLHNVDLGHPIDWNRDHECGRRVPLVFAPSIDYRVHAIAGDAKLVWEPNRHHQLVVLGRAYRATGDSRYAAAAVDQLTSWMDQCPPGRGMNWRSPLELAIRAINWTWTYDLIEPSGAITRAFRTRFLDSLDLQVWDIARKFSRGSSANNHVIGEAAGVSIAATRFAGELSNTAALIAETRAILIREIGAQTYADGCNREQAFGYHQFVTQFFLFAGVAARRGGHDFPETYWTQLERMLQFTARMCEAGSLPWVGDADDGYVLHLGGATADPLELLACGAALFGRADFKRVAGGYRETPWWLLGEEGKRRFDAIDIAGPPQPLTPHAFEDSGYYLLQHGRPGAPDAISVLFDCGELGFGSLAAHGHADALSLTVRALGGDLLIDPGTYDYFTYPAWREYFRSTRAHNTIAIDGENQSVPLGSFLWGDRAQTRCVAFDANGNRQVVAGEHDGYKRLPDPVVHRRTIELDTSTRTITVTDDLAMTGSHRVDLYFHFAPRCRILDPAARTIVVETDGGRATLAVDERLTVSSVKGSEDPIAGWASRGYHRREPAWTASAGAVLSGNARLVTTIVLEPRL
jgi:uncharacterized heparinase superfamily protein